MLRYSSTGTIIDTKDLSSKRGIRRLRLTLTDSGEAPSGLNASKVDKVVNGTHRRKNGFIQQERPAGAKLLEKAGGPSVNVLQNPTIVTNGVREKPTENGPRVHGVVQRTGAESQLAATAHEWPVSHLRDELTYIREVRDSLEKVREKMYGQFGGMQQSVKRLSQDIKVVYDQRRSLESEVPTQTAAMDSYDRMNSSLITSNIELQKSLLDSCSSRIKSQEQLRDLRGSHEQAEAKVNELQQQLAYAHAENKTLKLQVESCEEASSRKLEQVTLRLQYEYEEWREEVQRRHMEEVKALQAQISEYERWIEEAEQKVRTAEAKIAERDHRIGEVERLLDCMGKEKGQLQQKLEDCELSLRRLKQTNEVDAPTIKRSKQLEQEALDLRERIKHLNDMVFSQQKKVKGMIKEIDSLRKKVAQKDMYITDLQDRIAIIQCENNELEDKLKYFLSEQKDKEETISTRDIGVGCELPLSTKAESETAAPVLSSPVRSSPAPPSRVESSVLKYTPNQYSSLSQSGSTQHSREVTSQTRFTPTSLTVLQPGRTRSYSLGLPPVRSNRTGAHANKVYTPYMKLMEITANIKIE